MIAIGKWQSIHPTFLREISSCDEALAYGVHMAEHPGIKLTVVHFIMDHAPVDQDAITIDIDNKDDTYSS
ncbi:hypothetical protein FRX31_034728 [Thalictrum thalictroides]|uniref:Uncharacterized protein n=1 Tax=Thalictrum thalictroides TaxID=46969 RepID=A0A7J6UT19_THATH|nr:hypothetical protein FRX31_034728 [Thalictrum thalictroides]